MFMFLALYWFPTLLVHRKRKHSWLSWMDRTLHGHPLQYTPTEGRVIKRKVQHYGYVFDHQTANILRDRTQEGADCPEMPAIPQHVETDLNLDSFMDQCLREGSSWESLAGIVERTRQFEFTVDGCTRCFPSINQMAVNFYEPEGIRSHVDTPSAFDDGLISFSLNSGIVMEFRKVGENKDGDSRKLVYLPRRSLLLMSGPARYDWEHMIVTRRADTHNGMILPRALRMSVTFRTALDMHGSPLPVVETSRLPLAWGNAGRDSLTTPD